MSGFLENAISLFKKFPAIGDRQAERFARFILRQDDEYINKLIYAIKKIKEVSKQCPSCNIYHESKDTICNNCLNNKSKTLIILEKDNNVDILKKVKDLRVNYFILGKLIPISKDIGAEKIITSLLKRIKEINAEEIIFAFSVHKDAEHTVFILKNIIKKECPDIKVAILGRGLSTGSEIEYLDSDTITFAVKNRIDV